MVDPRTKKIFYIGKGTGNRVFNHAEEALDNIEKETAKLDLIREIKKDGCEVLQYIIRSSLSEEESLLISQFKSTILTTTELNDFYSTKPVKAFNHRIMAININKTYKNDKFSERHPNIYEAVRKSWKINLKKAEQAELVLAEYKSVVRGVFKPTKWYLEDDNRFMFDGEEGIV